MYTHYAPMVSYYSAKTRACLGYKRIPFVEPYEPATYRDRIAPAVGRTVFPVLESDQGEILQDTTVIIDALEQRHPERPVFPRDPVLMLVTRIVEFFVDELWVVTAMQTRWNDPDARRFVIAEFNRFFGHGDAEDIWANGDAVAERMQSYLPALGLDNEAGQRPHPAAVRGSDRTPGPGGRPPAVRVRAAPEPGGLLSLRGLLPPPVPGSRLRAGAPEDEGGQPQLLPGQHACSFTGCRRVASWA